MFNLTPVVKNLLIINVIIFFLQKILADFPLAQYLALWSVGTDNFRPYQLFTYMFAHADFMHILFNMMGLVFAGPLLEAFWGQKRFLLFYIITGIGAGVFNVLISLFLHPDSFSHMIGASGAVYGLITAYGVLFPNSEVRLLFFPFGIKAKYIVLVLGGIAIFSAVMPQAGDNVAHLAHLGGILVAIILIQVWKKRGTY
jgi:membrane associated rhomboid family serine protease